MIWDLPYQTQSFKGLLKNTDGFPKPKVTSPGTSVLLGKEHIKQNPCKGLNALTNYLKLRCFSHSYIKPNRFSSYSTSSLAQQTDS